MHTYYRSRLKITIGHCVHSLTQLFTSFVQTGLYIVEIFTILHGQKVLIFIQLRYIWQKKGGVVINLQPRPMLRMLHKIFPIKLSHQSISPTPLSPSLPGEHAYVFFIIMLTHYMYLIVLLEIAITGWLENLM